jgi:thiamine-phosphate pyrophosphorylase
MTPADRRSALRIVDASLNRAAEALRVAEDVCRFHWNLAGLSSALKDLRHRLFAAVSGAGIERREVLRARDIEGDVGRDAASPAAGDLCPGTLALRNVERAKEALRALSEGLRLVAPAAPPSIDALRYDLYALEKAMADLPGGAGAGGRARLARAAVYLVATSSVALRPLDEAVGRALEAGCDIVQLREKDISDRDALPLARRLRELTARAGALFIVNDRPDLALLARADGVHLGQEDLAVGEARELLGDGLILGVSTHSPDQALAAERQGADYIGIGPAFGTSTKEHPGPPLGPDGVGRALELVSLPAFAIGGITPERLPALVARGCRRVAISSAVLTAQDPGAAVRALRAGLTDLVPR